MGKVIGIDLGTTNSCVAIMEGGKPRVIENSEGDRTTPSIVAFTKDDEVLVGQSAKRQAVTNPQNTLFAVKRLIGRKFEDDVVQKDINMVPYKIVKADNGDAWVEAQGKKMAPPEISARVLMKMKKTAEDYLGEPVTEAVITVPAYFNDSQRQATKDAGRIAGLDVKRIINEPTAAALAYGLDKQGRTARSPCTTWAAARSTSRSSRSPRSTASASSKCSSTNGDTFLGGEDFDQRIIDFLAEEFQKESGVDVRKDPLAMQRLKEAAEKAKIELSSQPADRRQPAVHHGGRLRSEAPQHQADARQARVAGRGPGEEDHRAVPHRAEGRRRVHQATSPRSSSSAARRACRWCRSTVKDFFGKEPRKDVNPDEAVAVGAAIQGGVLAGEVKDVLLLDVTPLSLGIETLGGVMTKLIEKNTTIPTKAHADLLDRGRQPDRGDDPRAAGRARARAATTSRSASSTSTDIPPAPRGMPQIEVTFDIDANGILHVSAKDKATGKEQKIVIKASSGLSEDEIKRMVRDAEAHAEEDKKFRELVEARNKADALLHADREVAQGSRRQGDAGRARQRRVRDLRPARVLKGDDKSVIEKKAEALAQASAAIAQQAYAQAGAGGARAAAASGAAAARGRRCCRRQGRRGRRRVRRSQGQGRTAKLRS